MRAYRPQIVAYTFSKLVDSARSIGLEIDYKEMWDKQDVPTPFEHDIARISKIVFDVIYSTQGNIGTYCKQKACWEKVRAKSYDISSHLRAILVTPAAIKVNITAGKKEQKFADNIQSEIDLFNKGAGYWTGLKDRGIQQGVLTGQDQKNLDIVVKYCNYEYTELTKFQLKNALDTIRKLKDNGIE